MGVALFLEQQSWHSFGFTFFVIVSSNDIILQLTT